MSTIIRYQRLSFHDRLNLLLLMLCMLVFTVLFYGTALRFDKLTTKAVIHQYWGDTGNPPVKDKPPAVETNRDKVTDPRAAASLAFLSLAALSGIISLTALSTALFTTLAYLYLAPILFSLVCIYEAFMAFVRCYNIGGFLFGIFVVFVLIVELVALFTLIFFLDRKRPFFEAVSLLFNIKELP
ncbi:MAG: hypothetical protein V1794_13290 [Candidatus Glassbacteria bacterium]